MDTRSDIAYRDREITPITLDRAKRECAAHGVAWEDYQSDPGVVGPLTHNVRGVDIVDAGALLRWLGY